MITPGEQIRNSMIEHVTKAVEKTAYEFGTFSENTEFVRRAAAVLESSRSSGTTIFKASKDYMRGDSLYLGLCIVSTTCDAISASTCKFIPYRRAVWLSSKATSQYLMRYRNLCASEGC